MDVRQLEAILTQQLEHARAHVAQLELALKDIKASSTTTAPAAAFDVGESLDAYYQRIGDENADGDSDDEDDTEPTSKERISVELPDDLTSLDNAEICTTVSTIQHNALVAEPPLFDDAAKEQMTRLMEEWRRRGLDVEYFTSGSGAAENCAVM